jgi:hypothetical protein
MSSIVISLSEEELALLNQRAQQAQVSPEELARTTLADWLKNQCDDFNQAARYVLEKNAELYRRLA